MKQMPKSHLLPFTGLILSAIVWLANASNPPTGRTGAPFDGNCTDCHSNSNPNGYDGVVTVDGLPATVEANTTYPLTITLTATAGNPVRAGFQLVVVDGNNANAGDLTAGNAQSGTEFTSGREYLEQRGSKTFTAGEASWSFTWKAPASASGNTIKLYFIGTFCNGNSSSSGDYSIALNEAYGFTAPTPVSAAILDLTDVSCFGGNNGSATAEGSGGTAPYTYNWSNGQTGQTAVNLTAGTYTVTVTGASGSGSSTATVVITHPPVLNASVSVNGILTCTVTSVTATAVASGGTPTYTYTWSNGATANPTSITTPGTLTVTVTDDNGCTKVAMVQVTGNLTAPIAVAGPGGNVSCSQPTTTLNGTGSSVGANISYLWTASAGGNIVSGETTLSPLVNATGIYTLKVTNSSNGCTAFSSTQVSNWGAQNSGITSTLSSTHFFNNEIGWAVGDAGKILKTTNGGNSWSIQNSNNGYNLSSVYFLDTQSGWAIGSGGTILKTINGGTTWTPQNSGTTFNLLGVHFTDGLTGWVIGAWGTILKSTDGGVTWTPQNSGVGNWLRSVYFNDNQTGWAVGEAGKIVFTNDGGASWTSQTSGTTSTFYAVYFKDAQTGWAVGGASMLKTTNGGTTWTAQSPGAINGGLLDVHFTDTQTGWAVGSFGTIIRTNNGGTTWSTQFVETTYDLLAVYFLDNQTCWAVGTNGTILKYTPSAPSCLPTIPLHQQTNVDTTTAITWPPAGGCEDAYRLSLGTTPGGSQLLNNQIVYDTFYQPAQPLPAGQTIYVRITPYNGAGDASGCGEFSFATAGSGGGNNGPGLPAGDCWTWQNPLPQGNALSDVFFVDGQTGWAVGGAGTILKTANGGSSWAAQNSGTSQSLSSVHFMDAQRGWAVGGAGTILKTVNGGNTWAIQTSGTFAALYSVYFTDAQTGWAAGNGGTILKTANGGGTWASQTSGTSQNLNSVYFTDAQTGWAVGGTGTILKTVNGGSTWASQTSGTSQTLLSVYFTDAQTGWAVGIADTILKTVNGGSTWVAQTSGTFSSLFSVYFTDAQTGWAVGAGAILKTVNGGGTWAEQTSGTSQTFLSVTFTDAQTGWAVGIGGTILKTVNGGSTWVAQTSGTFASLNSVYFTDAQAGWAVSSYGTILKTVNGGSTWAELTSGTSNSLYSVHFRDAQTGWAVGEEGTILKTVNGGSNWLAQTSGTSLFLYSVHFTDAQTGWAVGNFGTILKTVNGGSTWVAQTSGVSQYLSDVYFTDAQTGWAVSAGGAILKTVNGGSTWAAQTSGTSLVLNSVHFTDAQTGWVVGTGGTILKTVNGGNTWTTQISGTTDFLRSVHFTDAQTGWVVGSGVSTGTILKTVNGGSTWATQTSGTSQNLNSVYFTDAQTGWVVGADGAILKYTPSTPSCIPTIPLHQQTNIPIMTAITWPPAGGCEDGYRLSLGTTPGGAQLLNNQTVPDTFYQPAQPLPAGQTIYVRVTPYNGAGEASGCGEFSFVTEGSSVADTIPPCIEWQNTIGGSNSDFFSGYHSMQQTADGGYILGGTSSSNASGDKTENSQGGADYWVIKLNATGEIQWQNTIGGSGTDELYAIQQTSDDGYILAGYSDSNISGDKTEKTQGLGDYWIVKLNESGGIEWQNTIGGNSGDIPYSIRQTSDGGYIVGGYSLSNNGGDKTESNLGDADYWVLKLSATGMIQWQNTIGGLGPDYLFSIQQTNDGGYILGGGSESDIGGDKTKPNLGSRDYWVVKLNASGNIQWQNTIGGSDFDDLISVQQTTDEGYIIGGLSASNISGDKTENNIGNEDWWVIKLDSLGTIQWQNTIGGSGSDFLYTVQQTVDNGYILGGSSESNSGNDKTENSQGGGDYWVVKLNNLGNIQWQNTIGGSGNDWLFSLQQTADAGYILGGNTASSASGDKTENSLGVDFWVIKLSPCTNLCPTDSATLAALYTATDGDNWTTKTHWREHGQPISTWYGVHTNAAGCVDTLLLDGNNLQNSLPVELGNLYGLKRLVLSTNNLSGGLPASFGNLKNLKVLNVSVNRLDQVFPALSGMTGLDSLYINQNRFTFEDFRPQMAYLNVLPGFLYTNQDSVFTDTAIIRDAGQTLTIDLGIDAGVADNVYTWTQNGQPDTVINGSNKRTFNPLHTSDAGTYRVEITNPAAPDLMLYSRAIEVQVNCAAPPLPALTGPAVLCSNTSTLAATGNYAAWQWSTGESGADSISVNAVGTYTVTVTDPNGCTGTVSRTLNNTVTAPSPLIDGPTALCAGTATLTAPGSYANWHWSTGQTGPGDNITVNNPGVYTVTVTDASGCTGVDTRQISGNVTPPTPAIDGPNLLCSNSSTLSVTGTYTAWQWSTGQSDTDTIAVNTQGTYIVTVTDNNGCTGTATKVVTGSATAPTPAIAGPNLLCSNSSTLSVAGNYTAWSWSTGQTGTDTITVNTQGAYTVTVTDVNGCTGTATKIVTSTATAPTPSIAGPNLLCSNASTLSAGGGTYTAWLWSTGQTGTATINVNTQGTYTVTVTDANGCTGTATKVVTGSATAPTPVIDGPNLLCSTASTLSVAGDYTAWQWSTGQSDTATIAVNTQGTYIVTVTDNNGCTGTATKVVTGSATAPTPSIAGPNLLCSNSSTLSVASNYTAWSWSTGESGTDTITVNTQGAYTVTVTDPNGCTGTATKVVTSTATAPTPSIAGPNLLCSNASTLSAGGGTYTAWLWSMGQSGTNSISVNMQGTYTVTVTDPNGCTGSATRTLTGSATAPTPVIAGPAALCSGTVVLSAAGNYTNWSWSTGQNGQQSSINVTNAATYAVTVTDANGCTGADTVSVSGAGAPSVAISSIVPAGCGLANGSINLTVSGGTSGYQFQWSNSATTEDPQNLAAGVYTVTVTDAAGCTATATAGVVNPNAPSATAVPAFARCGFADGSINLSVQGGTPLYQYAWSHGATTEDPQNLPPGTYTVTVTDAANCSTTTASEVVNPPAPTLVATPGPAGCGLANGRVDLAVSGGTMGYQYLWNTGATAEDLQNLAPGLYNVTVTDAANCTATATALVADNGAPSATVAATPATCGLANGAADLQPAGGVPPLTFLWSTGAATEDLNGVKSGTYTITITDADGCTTTAAATVPGPAPLDTLNLVETCLPTNTAYVVGFQLTGGTPPYTLTSGSGTLGGNRFDSQPFLSETPYSFSFTDAAGCGPFTVSGQQDCSCITALSIDTTICAGDTLLLGGKAYTQPGDYSATIEASAGCDTLLSLRVQTAQPGVLLDGDDFLCAGESALLIVQTQNCAGCRLQWSIPGFGGPWTEVKPLASTTYSVTATDKFDCSATDTLLVTVQDTIRTFLDERICPSGSLEVCGQLFKQAGQYTIVCNSYTGCDSIVELRLEVVTDLHVTAVPDTFRLRAGLTEDLFDLSLNDSISAVNGKLLSILEAPGHGEASPAADGAVRYLFGGGDYYGFDSLQYRICSQACPDSCAEAWAYILIQNEPPNAFTPNGDDYNETFDPLQWYLEQNDPPLLYTDARLTIWNRWGEAVYKGDYPAGGWDGRSSKGQLMPQGAYYYLLLVDWDNGTKTERKGVAQVLGSGR